MARFEEFSPDEVCDYVNNKLPLLEPDVLDRIVEHKIDGETFLVLNDEYLHEISLLLGDRLKIKKVIMKLLETDASLVSYKYYLAIYSNS